MFHYELNKLILVKKFKTAYLTIPQMIPKRIGSPVQAKKTYSYSIILNIFDYTASENIIYAYKMRNNYQVIISIYQCCDCKVIALIFFFLFVSALCYFFNAFSKVIALLTIMIAIVVALSRS